MWNEINRFIDSGREKYPFWYFLKGILWYGVFSFSFYRKDLQRLVPILQRNFYLQSIEQLEKEIRDIEKNLNLNNINGKLQSLTTLSLRYLHARLADLFSKEDRPQFSVFDLRNKPDSFLKEYPVILSTTFSSKRSLSDSMMFDYIIMDEASQVDIPTGALALSAGYNAVIVGDLKQLPNVVTENVAKYTAEIFSRYKIPEGYSYDFINGEVLMDAKVKDGKLLLNSGMEYSVLVLPKIKTMRPELLAKLETLVKEGLTIMGPAPEKSQSLAGYPRADQVVKSIADRMWKTSEEPFAASLDYGKGVIYRGGSLEQVLADKGIVADFRADDQALPLQFIQHLSDIHARTSSLRL